MNITEKALVPLGFKAAGAHVGLKKQKKDLSLIASEFPCTAAGCYTTNTVKAAPVLWDIKITESGKAVRGIVTNSGNANACTGKKGCDDTEKMAEAYAGALNCGKNEILVCSTGVIGVNLPVEIITEGITQASKTLGNTKDDFIKAAEAIITTDTFIKTASLETVIDGKKITFFGMAKGSGMIHPNMATMLSYIITDCNAQKEALDAALKECTADTFNMISVDGDTSTNDTVLLLANSAAGNKPVTIYGESYGLFKSALCAVMKKLAIDIVKDGEGATKLMEVCARGAKTLDDARKISKAVVSSNLFKAALFGADANWGRALCAMGYSGGNFDPLKTDILFKNESGEIKLMEQGTPLPFSEDAAKELLSRPTVFIDIFLNQGDFNATAWGCDLTYDYVKINGDYRT
jgi:glutamate N-acetyltransferase/amino-acid N-acetyltransferase